MQFHLFPNTELKVSQLCFGCWGIASDFHWGQRMEDESLGAMKAAIDAGIQFFDTAPVYGNGSSEELLGKFLEENQLRRQIVLASKVPPDQMRPKALQQACEDSLKRLRTDYLDLYQTHWTDREVPLADTWGAMQELVAQGKVRHAGVCNMGVVDMEQVCGAQSPLSNQLPYNLLWRMIEATILPKCQQESLGALAYSPFQHGLLCDKYDSASQVPDGRARSRHFNTDRALARHGEPGCERETFAAIDRVRQICQQIDRSMADVALCWTAQQPGVVSVIAGARNADQMRANVRCLDQPLSEDVLVQLSAATDELNQALGENPDMWDGGDNSRYR